MIYRFIYLLSFVFLASCEFFQQKTAAPPRVLARVDNQFLYEKDITPLITPGLSQEDSTKLAQKLVNDWLKRQLLLDKAQSEISLNMSEIERKVTEYRYSLIMFEFEKLYVQAHLNDEVSEEDIQAYYSSHSESFPLRQHIVKCIFIKVPREHPTTNQIRRDVRAYPDINREAIEKVTSQYGFQSFMEDSLWVNLDEVIINTPWQTIKEKTQFVGRTTYAESRDDDFLYVLRILDYKRSDEVAPLEFIREDIINIIVNKRKLALKKDLERVVYEEARQNDRFEIYPNR